MFSHFKKVVGVWGRYRSWVDIDHYLTTQITQCKSVYEASSGWINNMNVGDQKKGQRLGEMRVRQLYSLHLLQTMWFYQPELFTPWLKQTIWLTIIMWYSFLVGWLNVAFLSAWQTCLLLLKAMTFRYLIVQISCTNTKCFSYNLCKSLCGMAYWYKPLKKGI